MTLLEEEVAEAWGWVLHREGHLCRKGRRRGRKIYGNAALDTHYLDNQHFPQERLRSFSAKCVEITACHNPVRFITVSTVGYNPSP